jgi:hypothetical protein
MTRIEWTEHFNGRLAPASEASDYNNALQAGVGRPATAELHASFKHVEDWIRAIKEGRNNIVSGRVRSGSLTCEELGLALKVEESEFDLFVAADEELPDALHRRVRYRLNLRDPETNERFTLRGFKLLENDPGLDAWYDSTTLFTRIYDGVIVDESKLWAIGVLRIEPSAFVQELLSFFSRSARQRGQALPALRYGAAFLSEMLRTYVGKPVRQARPSFPIDRPAPGWRLPAQKAWRPVPGKPGLERWVYPFDVEDLDFPLNVQRLRRAGEGPKGDPVLLIPGSGVRANMFYGQPGNDSLAEHLLDAGYDVWVENWRASIDFPPNRYTLDQAARLDHPGALATVLANVEDGKQLRAVVHCQGSVSFLMAYLAGYLDDARLSHVVSSAVSLFIEIKWETWLKQRVAVPVVDHVLRLRWMDAQWGLRADTPAGAVFAAVAKPMERPCGNPVCQVACFMYGSGWDTLLLHEDPAGGCQLDRAVHDWSARELGFTPMTFLDQICDSSRYGYVVPARDSGPFAPASYLFPANVKRPNPSARFTFIAGDQNRMFRWQGQRKAAYFMRRFHGYTTDFVGIPGFGHLDTIWGRRAPTDVFPVIVDGLRWDAGTRSPSELWRERKPNQQDRHMRPDWPERHGAIRRMFCR